MKYDDRQEFEHLLIDRKLTRLLTSQAILFAAVAIAFDKECGSKTYTFSVTICSLGIAISVTILLAVIIGITAKYQNFLDESAKQKEMKPDEYARHPLQWGVKTPITRISLIPDITLPVLFAASWIIILCSLL